MSRSAWAEVVQSEIWIKTQQSIPWSSWASCPGPEDDVEFMKLMEPRTLRIKNWETSWTLAKLFHYR